MGLGPPDTRPGDELYVLHGGNVPFIVRTTREKFVSAGREQASLPTVYGVLVGNCFLDGFMLGEALEAAHRCDRMVVLC